MASQYLERINHNSVNDALAQAHWAEKKWVWLIDKKDGYLPAALISENGDQVELLLEDNTKRTVNINDTEKMNPPKFDRVEDMAELTHLNEASVVHNLKTRYLSNLIYTYSGLFCVTVNPYKKLPIYTDEIIRAYKGKKRSEIPPHVYCVVDQAYNDMVNTRENQSILITGESGAGKTENTKKVIQYLAASSNTSGKLGTLESQILQANPVLESFGNAQTIRNNNSSRFGKFIRIEFGPSGQIAGANIERYLLEKSRVTHQNSKERNYHIFYQLLKGGSANLKKTLLLDGSASDYRFTKNSNKNIDGVDDAADFKSIKDSLSIMNFTEESQDEFFRVIAAILHIGNLTLEADREDNAALTAQSVGFVEKVCHVLGVPVADFSRSLLKPRIKAGRDWVTQARNVEQVLYSIEALARSLYERMFGDLIDKINQTLYTPAQKSSFIGVLDIAGFEIFEKNSFEQLCINYTNERLQQFFNHHMFILEQEEYKREGIEWKFIDFGLDLLPTIELIEKTSPIGILSLLDEECVMPKATDKTFIDKLNGLWKGKSTKYDTPRFNSGFILQHYAGKVEYTVNGWLDKNKDPLNENTTRLLANSSEKYIASLFVDSLGEAEDNFSGGARGVIKKGAFRTVSQRHKESLASLMTQLYSTQPHFVRCIIPNEEKKPGKIDLMLVLDQLRCNGVLEGIRICRAGFPNRLIFQDFRSRYEVLAVGVIPKGYIEGRKASTLLLEHLALDKNQYRIGASKVFFKAGVLAELENQRDVQLGKIVIRIQAIMRGFLARKLYRKRIEQFRAIRIIQRNARIYVVLREWSWWKLFSKVKPLLNVTRNDEEAKKREALAKEWEEKAKKESEEKAKIEIARNLLDIEKKRIEDLLLQEQRAAEDQAEILTRTQKREMDLNDRVKEIVKELEDRDAQNETLLASKKKLEGEVKSLIDQSHLDTASLERSEKDKQSKDIHLKGVEAELAAEVLRIKKLESDKKSIESQLANLEEQLTVNGDNQADLVKQKSKMQTLITELEQKLDSEIAEKQRNDHKRASLEQELAHALATIEELERIKAELEATIKKREGEIASMNEQLTTQGTEKDATERQRRELVVKLQSAQEELSTEKSEREKLSKQKRKVDEELEDIHRIMQVKGNEESKQGEMRKLRDQDVSNLKAQLAAIQGELDESRKKGSLISEKLNSELEIVRQELAAVGKSKQTLDIQIGELRDGLERSEENRSRLERAKRQTDLDVEASKARTDEVETLANDIRSQKEAVEKQLCAISLQTEQLQGEVLRLDREKQGFQRTGESIKEELEQEVQKRIALEGQKKRLSVELSDLQARLDEEEISKNDANVKLSSKSAELEAVREKYNREVTSRTLELEDAKKRVEKDLIEAIAKLEEGGRNSANLERTRARLSAEIEDLKTEIEREHNNSRNAERNLKQVEAQVNAANLAMEDERRQREVTESTSRKLQVSIDSLQVTLDEKSNQITSLQKGKNDLDAELKALINEIGDGGKNLHELEKTRRKLDSRVEELVIQLESEQESKRQAEESKRNLDLQFSDFRKKSEGDLIGKDSLMDETRRILMKEVNSLGEQLDNAVNAKNDALKAKKKLDEQIEDLSSRAENSAKGQSEVQKSKVRNEALVRELQSRLEDESRNRENIQELCSRHEKKVNSLQTEVERMELLIDATERTKKQLNQKVDELDKELNSGDDSKQSLLETRRRLVNELEMAGKKLEESEEAREILEQSRPAAAETGLRGAAMMEYEDKINKLEDSRRALMAAQRLSIQEVDEKTIALSFSEKAKRQLQSDLDDLKARLETEVVAKGEESSNRRLLSTEVRNLQLRIDSETAKSNELADALALYKARADQAAEKLEAAELGRMKAEKNESGLKGQVKEIQDTLDEAVKARRMAEDQVKALEDQLTDIQDKLEDNAHELGDLTVSKKKLQEEINLVVERHRADLDEREAFEDIARKKYQKEIKSLMTDLEQEKLNSINLKESVRDLESEVEALNIKIDSELRSSVMWKKDKEKLDQKVEDLLRNQADISSRSEEQQNSINSMNSQIRELKANVDEKDALVQQFEKVKRGYEDRLTDLDTEFSKTTKERFDANKSAIHMDLQAQELREQVDDNQREIKTSDERARRAEQHAQDVQAELTKERSVNIELEKAKLILEKSLKELNSRIFELEGLQLNRDTNTARRLESRVEELSGQLEAEQKQKNDALKEARKADRTIRELSFQVGEKEKLKARFEEEQEKMDQKYKKLKLQMDELELSENNLQLAKRKAEREAADFRERAVKFEKEADSLRKRALA